MPGKINIKERLTKAREKGMPPIAAPSAPAAVSTEILSPVEPNLNPLQKYKKLLGMITPKI